MTRAPEPGEAGKAPASEVWWWVLMSVCVAVLVPLAVIVFAVVAFERLRDRLRRGKRQRECPGEPRVFAPSDFRSMDERRDT